MKKLRAVIRYECTTSFKYIWIFYGVEFFVIGLIYAISAISTGGIERVGTNCLETNTFIYIGVVGVLGFKEDFRMLIQNGFTRKYIFLATISMFVFISGVMALVDTVVGNMIHLILPDFNSVFGGIYGYDNVLVNWLWLFFVNMLICNLLYLVIIVINKIGKSSSIYLAVGFGAVIMICIALFRFVFPAELMKTLGELAVKAMGFAEAGTVNFMYPVLTLFLLVAVLGVFSYSIIRRTELRA